MKSKRFLDAGLLSSVTDLLTSRRAQGHPIWVTTAEMVAQHHQRPVPHIPKNGSARVPESGHRARLFAARGHRRSQCCSHSGNDDRSSMRSAS